MRQPNQMTRPKKRQLTRWYRMQGWISVQYDDDKEHQLTSFARPQHLDQLDRFLERQTLKEMPMQCPK